MVILEADAHDAQALEAFIAQNVHQESLTVITCPSVVELAKYLADGHVISALFADVWLGGYDSGIARGIEVVQKYRRYFPHAQVIYMAEMAHYTAQIYDTEHAYFLAKPFSQEGVNAALACALQGISQNMHNSLPVKIGTTVRLVKYSDILYIESQRRKLRIHTHTEAIDIYGSLAAVAAALPDQFIQCHKSFIVNLDYAVELEKEGFVMASGAKVAVSQTKRKYARQCFMRYLSVDL